ncbi:MAG: hypothetical protein JO235_19570 [Chroococcidiopsidaceae cyanobacterium CP_BM_RX_35]|nr:hypothetical protein [Chroococcidiopsidaceae cyanobacterium CP_BM_RX_35]
MNLKCNLTKLTQLPEKASGRTLTGILILAASVAILPPTAMAQPTSNNESNYETTADVIERAIFKNTPTFFRDQSIPDQFNSAFGVGTIIKNSYPENQDRRDSELVDFIYKDALKQQFGPTIRTQDLPNPYSSSLLHPDTVYPYRGFTPLPLR